MKVLIVYDTVSPSRTTATVAEAIATGLKEKGFDVDSRFVADANRATVKDYDCLLAGGPTMAFRATKRILEFLDSLPKNELSGKLGAAFDTQIKSRLSGSAVKGIEGKLKNLGLKLVTNGLVTYVEGDAKQNEWHLKEGELEKAKNWAEDLAKALSTQ